MGADEPPVEPKHGAYDDQPDVDIATLEPDYEVEESGDGEGSDAEGEGQEPVPGPRGGPMKPLSFVTSKLGNVDSETRSIAAELYGAAKAAGHEIWFMWGMGGGKEHGSGNALDLMIRNEAGGDFVRNYIWAHRARLRLRHVIWEQHITSAVVRPGVRRKMPDRGNATENHFDHVHVWFFDGDYVAPSSGGAVQLASALTAATATATRPTPGRRTLFWNRKKQLRGADVTALQTGLRRVFPSYAGSLELDGRFGPDTHRAVCEFQSRVGLEPDGRVGPATRAELKKFGIVL